MEGCECERKSMKNQFKNRKFRDKHFVAVVHMTITIRSSRNRIINLTFRLIFKLTKVSFLAHLAFKPCELLSSLFVRRPSVNISHFNLLPRNHWTNCNQTLVEWSLDGPLSNYARLSRLPTKMAAKLKIEKRGDEI